MITSASGASTRPAGIEGSCASSSGDDVVPAGVDQPEDLAGGGERRVGEGHPAVALVVAAGQGDAAVGDLEHRVAGHERGGVAVGAEAEVDEVEALGQRAPRSVRAAASRSRSVTGIGRSARLVAIEKAHRACG